MEKEEMNGEAGVGLGAILAPGSYRVEGQEMLLRVRVTDSPLVCLIDGERRVREIVAMAAQAEGTEPLARGAIAYDASRQPEPELGAIDEVERRKYAEKIEQVAERFEAAMQRFAADGRACLRKMEAVLSRGNPQLVRACRDGGAPALKAYLVRELFKRTVREERGFKILLLLSHVIAANGGGQLERLEPMNLDELKRLLREFMDFLKVAGHKRIDPRIFEEIYAKFNEQEYANLQRGGSGFFIKPLYIQEMQELKAQVISPSNSNYIDQLFRNSLRDSLDFLHENTLAYLKALAIVRLYANSNRKQRGGESKIVENVLSDLIAFRPQWLRTAGQAPALSA
jgi:hypothetical protein